MAGYSRIYVIGGLGGFEGADGVNPIYFQILLGDADRQWLEPHYFNRSIHPIGKIRRMIPEKPDDENMLLDACIAFYPDFFKKCPTMERLKEKLKENTYLDFHLEKDKIPNEWYRLRQEAKPIFKTLNIFKAELTELKL